MLFLAVLLAPVHANAAELVADEGSAATTDDRYGQIPLHFQVNKGQAPANVHYIARGNGYSVYVGGDEAFLVLKQRDRGQDVLRMQVVGANMSPASEPQQKLTAKVNYLRGKDRADWTTGVETYAKALYRDVYEGIDMVYYGTDQRQLEYDFVVAPNANPDAIRVLFEGAESMHLNDAGELVLAMSQGDVIMKAPYVYQEIDGRREQVEARYELLADSKIGFQIAEYDTGLPLVIDPILAYGTYLGGTGDDYINDIDVDKYGQAHVVGYTTSGDFPTKNPLQFNNFFPGGADYDTFVSKFAADGQTLLFTTYIGGSGEDEGRGIAVDKKGAIYITGWTNSDNFPVNVADETPYDDSYNGDKDIFVVKFNDDADGLEYSTYIGSGNDDVANDIALDDSYQAFIVGYSDSGSLGGSRRVNSKEKKIDAFVAEIDIDGDLDWLRFLGGDEDDFGNDIAVADNGEPVIVGTTSSSQDEDFPITPGAIQSLYSGGATDAFVARIEDDGDDVRYVTYLGGSDDDEGEGVDVDDEDDVYLVGKTKSADFSGAGMPDVHDNTFNGPSDGWLAKISVTSIDPLRYMTFIGGSGGERATSVKVDSRYRAHVTGVTLSSDFPDTPDANQGILRGSQDAFLAIYNAGASDLDYATYHGGDGEDFGSSIALDPLGNSYIAGNTTSTTNLPTASFDDSYNGGASDGFVAKYGTTANLKVTKTVDVEQPLVTDVVIYTIQVKNLGPDDITEYTVTDALPAGVVLEDSTLPDDCDEDDDIVTCDGGLLLDGETHTYSFTVQVLASTTIENCAIVSSPFHDPAAENNTNCATIAPREQTTIWRNANIEAGTVTALAHSDEVPPLKGAAASGTIFAGTDGGGVYRSTDGGDNWYPTDLVRTGAERNVRALAVDQADGDVFAGTYGEGVYYSDDLGDEFTKVNGSGSNKLSGAGKDIHAHVINNLSPDGPGGDGDIFVGTNGDGVWKSKNDGSSWKKHNGSGTGAIGNMIVRSLALIKGNLALGDYIYAGTHGGGVYRARTNDGGAVWEAINSGLENLVVHAVFAASNGDLLAGTNIGIYRSTNPKAATPTWTIEVIANHGYFMEEPVVRSFTEDKDGNLFAGTDGSYIFEKIGAEWEWTYMNAFGDKQYNRGLMSSTVLSLLAVTDNAGGDDIIFAGTQDKGVHRSNTTSDGIEWFQVSNETLNAVIQAMTFLSDGSQLYGGTYGFGVVMSDDFNGHDHVNWTKVNKGLANPWIYSLISLERSGLKYLFAGTWGGGVYRSTDGGENWMFSGMPHAIVYDMEVNKNDVIFAASNNGNVSRSVDQGLTWQEIGVATTAIWSLGIDPNNPNTIYAGTFGAGIYRSMDGGLTWQITGQTAGHVFDFAFGKNPETGKKGIFAATATGVIFSKDDGATWSDLSTGLTVADTRTIEVHPDDNDLLIAGTWGGGVFTYSKDARSWIRDGLPQMPVTAFAINPADGEVFAGTQDGGLFRRQYNASTVGAEDPDNGEMPISFELGQNYPNPFNPSTNIEFALPESQHVRLTIYDALGRQVGMLVDGMLPAGSHEVTFDAGELPSGVYLYRLEAHGQSMTHAMILTK